MNRASCPWAWANSPVPVTTRKFVVSGRVQQVGYRQFIQTRARALGLGGFVRNLPDGTVEITACGRNCDLDRLERLALQGPTLALVAQVGSVDLHPREYSGFAIVA